MRSDAPAAARASSSSTRGRRRDRQRATSGHAAQAAGTNVTEAMSASGEEYGEARLLECVQHNRSKSMPDLLEAILASVRAFARGAVQSDDVTALVLRYVG